MRKRVQALYQSFILLTVLLSFYPATTHAQWVNATNGNIYETSGNVGIQTSTPTAKLQVNKADSSFGEAIKIYKGADADQAWMTWSQGGEASGSWRMGYTGFPYDLRLSVGSSSSLGTEVMRWTTNGNVGIGTAVPDSKLVLGGTELFRLANNQGVRLIDIDFNGYTNATVANNGANYRIDLRAGQPVHQWWTRPAGSVLPNGLEYSRMVIMENGNVGIGTTSPNTKLQVNSAARISPYNDGDAGSPLTAAHADLLLLGGNNYDVNTWSRISFGGMCGDGSPCGALGKQLSRIYNYVRWHGGELQIANNQQTKIIVGGGDEWGRQEVQINPSGGNTYLNATNGNVGIGTTSPTTKLHVVGDVTVTGNIAAKYQDVAEWVPSSQKLSAGTVVVLDTQKYNQVLPSKKPYDTRVAGVVSNTPGLLLGEGGKGKVKVATTGRVKVKVDASQKPIKVGDLLVTSDKEGVAMKSEPLDLGGVPIHRPGTLIGKALEPLKVGEGEILVLLSLQ